MTVSPCVIDYIKIKKALDDGTDKDALDIFGLKHYKTENLNAQYMYKTEPLIEREFLDEKHAILLCQYNLAFERLTEDETISRNQKQDAASEIAITRYHLSGMGVVLNPDDMDDERVETLKRRMLLNKKILKNNLGLSNKIDIGLNAVLGSSLGGLAGQVAYHYFQPSGALFGDKMHHPGYEMLVGTIAASVGYHFAAKKINTTVGLERFKKNARQLAIAASIAASALIAAGIEQFKKIEPEQQHYFPVKLPLIFSPGKE